MDSLERLIRDTVLDLSPQGAIGSMTAESLESELKREQQNVARSEKQKGRRPQHRIPRMQLIFSQQQAIMEMQRKVPNGHLWVHRTIITNEYPPSGKDFKDLRPIDLKGLLVETVHSENYIVLRTITEPIRRTALSTVVEDHKGVADVLSLYNINVDLDDDIFLPIHTYIAIRAPYYKLSASGNYTLRCDHPSDFVKLHSEHNLVKQLPWPSKPKKLLGFDSSCEALKEEGNRLFIQKRFHAASIEYTKAMQRDSLESGSDMWVTLRCNRAVVRLRISQFEGALSDCEEVLTSHPRHLKALFLKARALYFLRQFDRSCAGCETLLSHHPGSVEGQNLWKACTERLRESSEGIFDFIAMQKKAGRQKTLRLDHADYIGPVKVGPCQDPSKGRGLFATRNVHQGELLVCEKAFKFGSEDEYKSHMTLNTVHKRASVGPDSVLPAQIVQFLHDNPSMAGPFLELYSGGRAEPSPELLFTAEGNPIIDSFTVGAIFDYNAFKAENALEMIETTTPTAVTGDVGGDCGIWIHASYLNHSCVGNVARTCIGDFMVIRAIRPIAEGDELCHPYVSPTSPCKERDQNLKKYGFSCQCDLCRAQRAISAREFKHRETAMAKFGELKSRVQANEMHPSQISQVRRCIEAIHKTYSNAQFCVELMQPHALLFRLQYAAGRRKGCIIDLREIIKLVVGADPLDMDGFEPTFWSPELLHYFFSLCVVLEDIKDATTAATCKRRTRQLLGIVSGTGYESAPLEDTLRQFKGRIQLD